MNPFKTVLISWHVLCMFDPLLRFTIIFTSMLYSLLVLRVFFWKNEKGSEIIFFTYLHISFTILLISLITKKVNNFLYKFSANTLSAPVSPSDRSTKLQYF